MNYAIYLFPVTSHKPCHLVCAALAPRGKRRDRRFASTRARRIFLLWVLRVNLSADKSCIFYSLHLDDSKNFRSPVRSPVRGVTLFKYRFELADAHGSSILNFAGAAIFTRLYTMDRSLSATAGVTSNARIPIVRCFWRL